MRLTDTGFLYIVLGPIAAGILCLISGDRAKALVKATASAAALGAFGLSLAIFIVRPPAWHCAGSKLFFCDNLSAMIGLAISFMALVVIVYSCGSVGRRVGSFFGYALMTLGASLGAAFAGNLVLMLVFWGFLAAMLYMLTNLTGTGEAAAAAKKALIIIGATDALMIFGIGLIWVKTGTLSVDAIRIPLVTKTAYAAYFSVAIAAFAKAGAMPFHSWLPDVAEEAPASVTAFLPASLDKLLGIYLLARASLGLFTMSGMANLALMVIGSATIIIAVMLALAQHNFKRLLGYHAVSQVGYMVIGIGTGTAVGIAGGLFHMLNHAVYKSCLFLGSGAVEKEAKTVELADLGGLAKYMPVTFVCFAVAALSISGIPPLNGFFSKWMIYQGVLETATKKNPLWIIWLSAAMFGGVLTIASFMKLIHAVFLGRAAGAREGAADPGILMTGSMAVLAAVCVIFGVFALILPIPFLIAPVLGKAVVYAGTWRPVAATAVMLTVIAAGAVAYLVFRPGRFRRTETFIGGEDPEGLGRISGVDFYDTIKDIRPVGKLYRKEAAGDLDVYSVAGKVAGSCLRPLQFLHNGILPTYLVWCLLGMTAIFLFLFTR